MTDRAEIERLLNQTGRTLKWLPEDYGDKKLVLWNSFRDKTFGHIKSLGMANRILHQSDVIELLVGALRDALDKPMQKPLTLRELHELIDSGDEVVIYIETNTHVETYANIIYGMNIFDRYGETEGVDFLRFETYGKIWRAWATRPTDEESEAAAWET